MQAAVQLEASLEVVMNGAPGRAFEGVVQVVEVGVVSQSSMRVQALWIGPRQEVGETLLGDHDLDGVLVALDVADQGTMVEMRPPLALEGETKTER